MNAVNWHRLRVKLLNIRTSSAMTAHHLSVFQAIIKGVTSSLSSSRQPVVFFHLKDKKHTFKLRQGCIVELEILFCQADYDYISRWSDALRAYLSDPETGKNFDIIEIGDIEQRSFDMLASEIQLHDEGELCLEFLTPVPFNPIKDRHRTYLTAEQFIRLFEKRFKRLFDIEVTYKKIRGDDFRLLPYYWNYTEIRHPSHSQPGSVKYINGCTGKLYLKGKWSGLVPFLILGSELHTGVGITYGRGYYKIHADSPGYFSAFFPNKQAIVSVIRDVTERYDDVFESLSVSEQFPFVEERFAEDLCSMIAKGTYTPEPNTAFVIKKKGDLDRLVERLGFRDLIVQQYILKTISEHLDRMFEETSIGFRKGVSRQRAIEMVHSAIKEGYIYVIESDIEEFFPSVDHNLLMESIEYFFLSKDICIKSLINKCNRVGYILNGVYHERPRGLAQGSPLSPILANLYLDTFDEEVKGWDAKMIRYADDFIIMVRSLEDAERVLVRAEKYLSS